MGQPGFIAVIHCLSNQLTSLEDTLDALERLKPLSEALKSAPSRQAPTAVIPLCETCIRYKEQIEENVRDQVINEIFARKRKVHSEGVSFQNGLSSVQEYLDRPSWGSGDESVAQIIYAYDQENRELLLELAEQKKKVRELSERLGSAGNRV